MILGLKLIGKLVTRKYKCWIELKSYMVLGFKSMGNQLLQEESATQNQGPAWSSDSNLWGN